MSDQRVLITGAASGLGRTLANAWARRGARLVITDIDMDGLAATAKEIGSACALAAALDVRQPQHFSTVARQVDDTLGGIDIVINNAGVACAGTAHETDLADWDWVVDTNLMGVVRGCREWVPRLIRQGGGHVVNIASFAGLANAPGAAAYNTAKAGVIALSETMRAELHASNVGVTVVCPFFFETKILDSARGVSDRLATSVKTMMRNSDVTADDVAAAIIDAVASNNFMVITHKESRRQYFIKRLFPETFRKQVQRLAGRLNNADNEPR